MALTKNLKLVYLDRLSDKSVELCNDRFFLGREVPRESLVFLIRAVGGEASWDESCAPGATFKEDDAQVTHQVRKGCVAFMSRLRGIIIEVHWPEGNQLEYMSCLH